MISDLLTINSRRSDLYALEAPNAFIPQMRSEPYVLEAVFPHIIDGRTLFMYTKPQGQFLNLCDCLCYDLVANIIIMYM